MSNVTTGEGGFLAIVVDWDGGEITPITSQPTMEDAIEALTEQVKEGDGDVVGYVLPIASFVRQAP